VNTNILWHIIAAKSSAVKDFSGMESTGQIKLNGKIVYGRRHGVDEKNICIADVGLFFCFSGGLSRPFFAILRLKPKKTDRR
jgi:hypothetical protein